MGSIRSTNTGRTQLLEPEHLVGRSAVCALHLDERYISAQHALLRYSRDAWQLKDLGSRNGTFLDGAPVKPGEERSASVGSKIAFGKLDQEWELVDASPPEVMAVPIEGGEPVLLQGEFMALPSNDDPRATIYRLEGSWVLEPQDEPVAPIRNLQVFDVAGRAWRFCCPDTSVPTSLDMPGADLRVPELRLAFSVSRDEEHVQLQLTCTDTTIDMGTRSHNYLLLTLARRRAADAAQGLEAPNCGWINLDELAHDPAMAPPQLNIDVFRIRRQFAAVGVLDAAGIIERRPRTRQLRIGTGHILITTL
jgi:hypothetical protein